MKGGSMVKASLSFGTVSEYRRKHADRPAPNMPCRGIVVATSDPDDPDLHQNYDRQFRSSQLTSFTRSRHEPPLRLLVIGDSLAAGVGVQNSRTPVLPESIASSLSQALGGRAVYWTCVGTPGLSSSLLVQEIHQLGTEAEEKNLLHPAMLQQLEDWQRESRLRGQKRFAEARSSALQWWDQRRKEDYYREDEEIVEREIRNLRGPLRSIRLWIGRRIQRVRRDAREISNVVRKLDPLTTEDGEDPSSIFPWGRHRRKPEPTVDPSVVGPYDIAVVLTGLNDLKDVFLPFMMSAQRRKEIADMQRDQKSEKKTAFDQIIEALQDKMNLLPAQIRRRLTSERSAAKCDQLSSLDVNRRDSPLVVFPAMPVGPTIMARTKPLSWFLVPVIKGMDRNKELLAEMYPGLVVFVDAPDEDTIKETEAGKGPIWKSIRESKVILRLSDKEVELDSDLALVPVEPAKLDYETKPENGVVLISDDGIHPSDIGYDFWGRYIAAEIVRRLKNIEK